MAVTMRAIAGNIDDLTRFIVFLIRALFDGARLHEFAAPPLHTLDVAGGFRIERLIYLLIMVHIDWGESKLQTFGAATARSPHQSRNSLRFEGHRSFEFDVPLVEETPTLGCSNYSVGNHL